MFLRAEHVSALEAESWRSLFTSHLKERRDVMLVVNYRVASSMLTLHEFTLQIRERVGCFGSLRHILLIEQG